MKSVVSILTAIAVLLGLELALPVQAEAASSLRHCRTSTVTRLAGFSFKRMPTPMTCQSLGRSTQVGGISYNGSRNYIVIKAGTRAPRRQVQMAQVHEMTHQVEYRTTRTQRARLYRHIGVRNDGSYIYSGPYRGLGEWKTRPSERLAESVVKCRFGRTNISGVRTVSSSKCRVLLRDFQRAANAAR